MSDICLVVFDMAGTTVHDGDAVHRCLMEALREAGTEVTRDEVNAVMGIAKPEAIRLLLEARGAAASPEVVRDRHQSFQARMRRHYEESPEVREVPGAEAVFAALRESGIRVALNTGFDRETAQTVMERLGWRVGETVDALVTVSDVERGRPHPDMIRECMRRTGVGDPLQVAKVGDTPADLGEGMAADCALVIGVTFGSHLREELSLNGHTHLIDSLGELPGMLGSLTSC